MQSKLDNILRMGNAGSKKGTRIAWGAIFAGTIVCLGYATLLNFLGIGLGLASLNSHPPHIFNLKSGVTIWLIVSGMVSMGIGGWFTGKFSGISCAFRRGCQGVIAWSLAVFLTVMAATTTLSTFMGGTISLITIPNAQETTQTIPGAQSESLAMDPTLDNIHQNIPDNKLGNYVTNLSKAAIAIFIAFLMSGIASVAGATLAKPEVNTTKESEEAKL